MRRKLQNLKLLYYGIVIATLLSGCGENGLLPSPTPVITIPPGPTETFTSPPPTPTLEPLAARVNGEGITEPELEAELARYNAGIHEDEPVDVNEARKLVLDDLINQVLLAQAARENGFSADESLIQSRMENVIANAGGEQPFEQWLDTNSYTRPIFEAALGRAIEAAWMRDRILAEVPEVAEQLYARQILLYNAEQANQVLADLRAGTDFATLAVTYDPIAGGDLGWFPRGYLTDAQLEEAAFGLSPGEYTEVIETDVGYHILQLIERDPARPLDPEARLLWQEEALRSWIDEIRDQAQIEIFIP